MRKLRIVLKENINKVLLKEASYFSGRAFQVHKELSQALTTKKPEVLREVESLETITQGHPKSVSLDSYTKLSGIITDLNLSLKETEGPGKFTQILNDFSKVDLFLTSVNELRDTTKALQEYYRATVYPFHVDELLNNNRRYYNLIETVNSLYGRELTLTLQQVDGYLKKLNAGAGSGFIINLAFGASDKQKKELVNLIAKSIAYFISRVVDYKLSSERYSQSLITQLNGAEGGGAGGEPPPTTPPPTTPPTTTPPEGAGGAGGEPPPAEGEAQELGNKNPVPLFNKGSTSDSLLSAMLMGMNQRIQNNSKDGKGLILSVTDSDKKIRLIDAFKNYDKLTPNSKKFVDQIQFIMKDLAGQLKANGIRIQEAATPVLSRTVNPEKNKEKFRTSAPDPRDRDPKKRASGEDGGGLEMVTPVVGSIDVRRAIYRKILRAIQVLVSSSGNVFKGDTPADIDNAAMNIADGAAKVAIKFLVSNLSQRGVNVTDKRSKVKVSAKNVGKNYGKEGDPDAGKEKNITLLENKSKLLKEYREHIETKLVPYMQKQIGFNRPPVINFLDDTQNASDPFGKTAFYDPQSMEISVYTTGRHPKDIMRSVAHEVIHHAQNCRGQLDPQRMGEASEGYAQKNPYLRKLEEEAYLLGNMTFRDWEDGMKTNQLNEMHDCNKVHPNKSHAVYKREDKPEKEEKSLDEWRNEERWDLLMKRFNIVSEKRFANDPKLDKDGDGKPKWADEDDNNPKDSKKQVKSKQVKGKK